MRILFLINSFYVGGFEQLMLEVFRNLVKEDVEVVTVCLKGPGKLAPELERLGIPVKSGFIRWKYDLTAPRRVRKALEGQRFDLAFVELGRNALLVSEYLAKKLGIPKRLSSIHGTFLGEDQSLLRRGHLPLLARLDGIVACAETQAKYLVNDEGIDPKLIHVIVNGVDHHKFRPLPPAERAPWEEGLPDPAKGIATVGSLTARKGHRLFIDAAEITLRRVPDATFFIIGGGEERGRIEEIVRDKELERSIVLLGIRRDLPQLLPHFRAVALASTPDGETLPISTMEAMACGVPAVNTDVGSVRDLVVDGETGYVVPPADVNALADAFVKILEDDERAARMAAASRARVEKLFTLERAVREYGEYFRSVAGVPAVETR